MYIYIEREIGTESCMKNHHASHGQHPAKSQAQRNDLLQGILAPGPGGEMFKQIWVPWW